MAKCTFSKGVYTAETLFQWDYNQEVEIAGLSLAITPEVHFFHDGAEKAIVRQATMDASGVIRAKVPNSLLQKPYRIHAIICIYEGTAFRSLCELRLPVQARAKPDDYVSIPEDEVYSMEALGVKTTILPPGADPTVSRYLENGEGYFVFGLPQPVSISSIERTSGDGAPGTTDIYTVKMNNGEKYDLPIYNGSDGNAIVAKIFVTETDDGEEIYSVQLPNGSILTDDERLVALAKSGAVIVGILQGDTFLRVGNWGVTVPAGTVFTYENSFENIFPHESFFEFRIQNDFARFTIMYDQDEEAWIAKGDTLHTTVTIDGGASTFVRYNGELVSASELCSYVKRDIRYYKPVFCYQQGKSFYTKDASGQITPPKGVLYTVIANDDDDFVRFRVEHNGHLCTLTADPWDGYSAFAEPAVATDSTLTLNPGTGVLSVNMADSPEADNTLPISAAAVHTTVGNIDVLLKTI